MSNKHILVVDDERIIARGIQTDLKDLGYETVDIAVSGKEAVEKVSESHPDLVLMDISLKGEMDGIEATRQIHERCDVPVVYLSAYADKAMLDRAKTTEPYGYLLKPYEEKELVTTIETALYKHRMEQKVKQAERWLTATLRSIDDAVLATDAEHKIRFMNPVAEALTGWDQETAVGMDIARVCRLVDKESRAPMDYFAGKSAVDCRPSLLLSRDGREIPVEGRASPIHDDHETFSGIVVVFRDIRPRRELRAEQKQSEERITLQETRECPLL